MNDWASDIHASLFTVEQTVLLSYHQWENASLSRFRVTWHTSRKRQSRNIHFLPEKREFNWKTCSSNKGFFFFFKLAHKDDSYSFFLVHVFSACMFCVRSLENAHLSACCPPCSLSWNIAVGLITGIQHRALSLFSRSDSNEEYKHMHMYVHGAAPQNCPGTKLPEMHSSLDIFLIFAPPRRKERWRAYTWYSGIHTVFWEERERGSAASVRSGPLVCIEL